MWAWMRGLIGLPVKTRTQPAPSNDLPQAAE
jgi:hypothetical protein